MRAGRSDALSTKAAGSRAVLPARTIYISVNRAHLASGMTPRKILASMEPARLMVALTAWPWGPLSALHASRVTSRPTTNHASSVKLMAVLTALTTLLSARLAKMGANLRTAFVKAAVRTCAWTAMRRPSSVTSARQATTSMSTALPVLLAQGAAPRAAGLTHACNATRLSTSRSNRSVDNASVTQPRAGLMLKTRRVSLTVSAQMSGSHSRVNARAARQRSRAAKRAVRSRQLTPINSQGQSKSCRMRTQMQWL